MVFVDLQKAYDSVPLSNCDAVKSSGVKGIRARAAKTLHSNTTNRKKVDSALSPEFI